MRLIHTADVHLDACFASSGMPADYANRRRQGLRDVFRAILKRAEEWPADALLIAGDLFELERVSRDTVAFLKNQFESISRVPVFIAPGNHDPVLPHSPYVTESWPANVMIFPSPTWTHHTLDWCPLTVHGFGFDGPRVSVNPFGTLDIPEDDQVHVAVAHGSERSHQPPHKNAYAAFDAEEAAAPRLAYLALGHFHAMTSVQGDFKTAMYYSGAPEGLSFRDLGTHHYLEIEVENGQTIVNPVPSSNVEYAVETLSCSQFESTQELIDAVRALPGQRGISRIARLTLTGERTADWHEHIASVYDVVGPLFEYLDLIDATEPADDYDTLAAEETSLGQFVRRITQEISDEPEPDRRRLLVHARTVGLAAYKKRNLPIQGVTGE